MKNIKLILTIVSIIFSTTIFAQSNSDKILGEWFNAKKDAKILIYKNGSKFYGKITWGSGETKDVKNPDIKLRTRELIGLTILNDFSFDGNKTFENGSIYDPKNGKTYSCKLTLNSPTELEVRGYVGISLFGRTEIWTK